MILEFILRVVLNINISRRKMYCLNLFMTVLDDELLGLAMVWLLIDAQLVVFN